MIKTENFSEDVGEDVDVDVVGTDQVIRMYFWLFQVGTAVARSLCMEKNTL